MAASGAGRRPDLAEYLLDYFPRKVSVEDETLHAVPECVRAFLGFLDARGSLSGEPLEQLEQACEELSDEFLEHARDSSHWGLAKSMVMRMQAEGLDPSAAGALDAWMTDFNARPREERDAIIGPAADRMARAAGLPSAAEARAPKQQRRNAARRNAKRASATAEADTLNLGAPAPGSAARERRQLELGRDRKVERPVADRPAPRSRSHHSAGPPQRARDVSARRAIEHGSAARHRERRPEPSRRAAATRRTTGGLSPRR